MIGPPPTASGTFVQGGVSVSSTVTFAPTGASAERKPACAPRATRTAPSGGIGWLPPLTYCVTTPVRGVFGVVAGKGWMIACAPPFSAGVRAPHACVYSVVRFGRGASLIPRIRRWPDPCHVPARRTRSTWRTPSVSIPTVERKSTGPLSRIPSRIRPPVGCPSVQLKRSPLTLATVASAETRFCIEVTRSRPRIALFDSTGFSAYSPVGFGAEITWITTGPCPVNSTCRE